MIRTGDCKKCGQCCRTCGYKVGKECSVYDRRPAWCLKDFPRSEVDLYDWGIKDCGYRFIEE